MNKTLIALASLFAVLGAVAAAPREALPFSGVKPGGELRSRIAKNFERLHADRYRINNLFTKSHDSKWPGDMEGRVTLGLVLGARALGIDEPGIDDLFAEYPRHFQPVYHLLDPTYDQIKGSWRQMLFPRN